MCDSKRLFSFLGKSKEDQRGISSLNHDSDLITDNTEKSNILNHQFQSVFTNRSPLSLARLAHMKVQAMVDCGKISPGPNYQGPQTSVPKMPTFEISINGIIKLLGNLKPGKAAGPDKIRPLILKELKEEISPIIQVIFERSIETGKLPIEWCQAYVTPVFKKGDKTQAVNYRPISLTCILCKVMELIMASQIVKHMNKHSLLYDLQHGFREKRSCETQLTMLVEDLSRAANKGKQTDLILLDFSKAFDKVNHPKLIWKLHQYGIRSHVLRWIQAFLGNRSQSVVVGGEESDSVPVCSGVPQGSVFGPILFLIYINDLPDTITTKVRLFADDTALYLTIEGEKDSATLHHDLGKLSVWERQWDMEFNPSKCQVIQVTGSRNQFMQTTVSMATSWKLSPVPGILGLKSPVACPGAPI